MMLSLILASGILSEAVIRRLHAERNLPHRIFADSNAPGSFLVSNPAGWPSLSIEVVERGAMGLQGPLSGQNIGPQHIPWWKFWRRTNRRAKDATAPNTHAAIAQAYSMRVEARERQDLATRYLFPARGRFELPGLDIITRFPFGLFEKRRELDACAQLTVFPAACEAREWLSDIHAHFGDITRHQRGSGEDFFGLRDYQPGEDQGLIQTLLQSGWRVGLRSLDTHLPASSASNHADRMLETLALVELKDGQAPIFDAGFSTTGSIGRAPGARGAQDARILIGLAHATALISADFDLVLSVEKDAANTQAPLSKPGEAA